MERRASQRIEVCLPMGFDSASARGRAGIARDVSDKGALLLTRDAHEVDEPLLVRFRPDGPGGAMVEVKARVVRSGPNPEGWVWPTQSAIEFEEALNLNLESLTHEP